MKVLITNTVVLNGGDAAILQAIVQVVREAYGDSTEVVAVDGHADVAAYYYPDDLRFVPPVHQVTSRPAVPYVRGVLRPFNRARVLRAADRLRNGDPAGARALLTASEYAVLNEYHTADVVIATGGTYLVENYDVRGPLFEFDVIRRLGRPLVLFTQSLGPFSVPKVCEAIRRTVDHASLVLLRDQRSLGHLLDVGADPAKLHVSADAAFALGAPSWGPRADGPPRVAISVRHWSHFKTVDAAGGMRSFVTAVAGLARHLVEGHDADVTFLSSCQGIPEYWADDAKVARAIVGTLPPDIAGCIRVDDAFHDPRELVERLGTFDVTVATRMHMAILSLVAGTPVLPVAYEFKTNELFERLGMGKWVHDIENADGATLSRSMDALLAALPEVRATLASTVAKERARARSAVELLRRVREPRAAGGP